MRVYLQAGGETQEVLIEPHMTVSTVKERFVALNLVKGLLPCDLELTFAGMRLSNPDAPLETYGVRELSTINSLLPPRSDVVVNGGCCSGGSMEVTTTNNPISYATSIGAEQVEVAAPRATGASWWCCMRK